MAATPDTTAASSSVIQAKVTSPDGQTPPPISVVIATPCFASRMTSGYLTSLLSTHAALAREGIECSVDFIGNESLIPRARNILVQRFLNSPRATHLFFLDSDIVWNPQEFLKVLRSDKDVSCAAYSKKNIDFSKVASGNQDEPAAARGLDYNINNVLRGEGGLLQVSEAATGFMCIKRQTLEGMASALPDLWANNDILGTNISRYTCLFSTDTCEKSRRFLSEDYAFCRRAIQCGYEVWVDPSVPLVHVGTSCERSNIMCRFTSRYEAP